MGKFRKLERARVGRALSLRSERRILRVQPVQKSPRFARGRRDHAHLRRRREQRDSGRIDDLENVKAKGVERDRGEKKSGDGGKMQLRVGQTKQLAEEMERKMALLDDMVRTYETSTKTDTGIRTKPKDQAPALPKFEDRLVNAINEALKAVTLQEKKVADLEKELGHANTSLVEERTRQQRIRSMQMACRRVSPPPPWGSSPSRPCS